MTGTDTPADTPQPRPLAAEDRQRTGWRAGADARTRGQAARPLGVLDRQRTAPGCVRGRIGENGKLQEMTNCRK